MTDFNKLLSYQPQTGLLFWLPRTASDFGFASCRQSTVDSWNDRNSGRPAFRTVDRDGYLRGEIRGRKYRAHRVIWQMVYGDWPDGQIDHVNGDRADNRIANLRAATNAENQWNTRVRSDSTSGVKGVTWNKQRSKWQARIEVSGRRIHIGLFDDLRAASIARDAAARRLHGAFATNALR